MALVSLNWKYDPDGYDIDWRPLAESGLGISAEDIEPGSPASRQHLAFIVRKGGDLQKTEPLRIPALHWKLADYTASPKGALEFVSKYGFMHDCDAHEEQSSLTIAAIMLARQAKKILNGGDKQKLIDWLDGAHLSVARPALIPRDEGVQFQFQPLDLRSAIFYKMLIDLARGAKFKKCTNPACPEYFEYGPGTNPPKRDRAMYCTPTCQKAHAYMKSKEAKK